jgi:hypothetical protein
VSVISIFIAFKKRSRLIRPPGCQRASIPYKLLYKPPMMTDSGMNDIYVILECPSGILTNLFNAVNPDWSHDHAISIATRLRAGRSVLRLPMEAKDFSLFQNVQTNFGTHPASFQGVKLQELNANHSPPSSAKVKNEWIYTFTPPKCSFRIWYVFLVKTNQCTRLLTSKRCVYNPYICFGK